MSQFYPMAATFVTVACLLTSAFPVATSSASGLCAKFALPHFIDTAEVHVLISTRLKKLTSICRWYQDPGLASEKIPAVCRTRELAPQEFRLPTRTIRSAFASNPLDTTSHDTTPPPSTQTVPARDVFHNVQAAIRPLMAGIQTREQVSELIHNLEDLQYMLNSFFEFIVLISNSQRKVDENRRERIMDPPVINPKGRPRTTRLTNAREGRQRGGGATNKTCTQPRAESEDSESQAASGPPPKKSRVGMTYKCALCRQEGHNRSRCPLGGQNSAQLCNSPRHRISATLVARVLDAQIEHWSSLGIH